MSFGFERPFLAVAAFVVIPLIWFIASRLKNPFVVSLPLGAPGGVPFKTSVAISRLVKVLRALEYAGLFLLFLSAAEPVLRTRETVWLGRGADIIFVLDISPSMAALDMDGRSRFYVARELLLDFAAQRPSDSIGLAAVGSDAALLLPPTTDRLVLQSRLDHLRLGELGEATALGMGLAVAAFHLEGSQARRRVAVLLTDGENNAGAVHPESAAAVLRDMGASLWVIGIGSGGIVPIDYLDPFTMIRHTGMYDSAFDEESLRALSLAGGGTYIPAPTASALAAAFDTVDDGELIIRRSSVTTRLQPLAAHFLIAALALLAGVRFVRRFLLGAWL
ncbi:MAG: VWA domain-containing protein [Spirochaetes bacterium]|nr:VWA domain-containing protein [Spirochaetota bacterium]